MQCRSDAPLALHETTSETNGAHLICEVSALHSQISADVFIDGPGKLIVEFPGHDHHQQGAHGDHDGNDDQEGLSFAPHVGVDGTVDGQVGDGIFDLLDLHGSIDQKTEIAHTDSDDLDGVFQSEGVVDEHQLVDETETVEGQEGRDGFRGGDGVGLGIDLKLEVGKDIAAWGERCQRPGCLAGGDTRTILGPV